MKKNEILKGYSENVASFLSNHVAIGTSKTTINNYKSRLSYFFDFLAENLPDEEADILIDASIIRCYRDFLISTGRKPGTVKQYLVELHIFFSFTCDPDMCCCPITEILPDGTCKNPVNDRLYPKYPKADTPYTHILNDSDLLKLWKNEIPGNNPTLKSTWARNYAIIILLIDSKIRNNELLSLRLCDVNFERNEITILSGKGGKYRVVTVSEITTTALKIYLKSGLRPSYCTEKDFLFGTEAKKGVMSGGKDAQKGERWHKGTAQWLSQLVDRHVKNVTGKTGFRTHSLRHAGAVLDLNSGERIERIQAELGHSSVKTTEIYTSRLRSVSSTLSAENVKKVRDVAAKQNERILEGIA